MTCQLKKQDGHGTGKAHDYIVTRHSVSPTHLCSCHCHWHSLLSESQADLTFSHALLQGWIPRSGLQYGTDLVLYEKHPSLVHSTICVIIVPMAPPGSDADQTPTPTPHGTDDALSWHDVEGINRLCIRVNCFFTCLASPSCIALFCPIWQWPFGVNVVPFSNRAAS